MTNQKNKIKALHYGQTQNRICSERP